MGALLVVGVGTLVNAPGPSLGCLLGDYGGALGRPLGRRLLGAVGSIRAVDRALRKRGFVALPCRPGARANLGYCSWRPGAAVPLLIAALLADLSPALSMRWPGRRGTGALPAAPALAAAILVPILGTAVACISPDGLTEDEQRLAHVAGNPGVHLDLVTSFVRGHARGEGASNL